MAIRNYHLLVAFFRVIKIYMMTGEKYVSSDYINFSEISWSLVLWELSFFSAIAIEVTKKSLKSMATAWAPNKVPMRNQIYGLFYCIPPNMLR